MYNLFLTQSGETIMNSSTSGMSYTFIGLEEYTRYSCVITAISIYGPVSAATAPVSATTLQAGSYINQCFFS